MGYREHKWAAGKSEGLPMGGLDFWADSLESMHYESHAVVRGYGDEAHTVDFWSECDTFRSSYKLSYKGRPRNYWPEMLPVLQSKPVWRLLGVRDKELLELFGQGLKQKIIASRLKVTQSAVSTRVHHVIGRIRKLWDLPAWERSDLPTWDRAGFGIVARFLQSDTSMYEYIRAYGITRSSLGNRIKTARRLLERGFAGESSFGARLYSSTTAAERERMLALIRGYKPWCRGLHQETTGKLKRRKKGRK